MNASTDDITTATVSPHLTESPLVTLNDGIGGAQLKSLPKLPGETGLTASDN